LSERDATGTNLAGSLGRSTAEQARVIVSVTGAGSNPPRTRAS